MLSEGISNHLINENYKYGNFSYDLEDYNISNFEGKL